MDSGKMRYDLLYRAEKGNDEIHSAVFMDTSVFIRRGAFKESDSAAGSGFDLRTAPASSGASDRGSSSGSGKGSLEVSD